MDYFVLKQDSRYTSTPMLEGLREKLDMRDMYAATSYRIPDKLLFQVKGEKDSVFTDVLDRQLFLLSDGLKRLVELYEPRAVYKMVILMHMSTRRQKTYYLPFFEELMCLSPYAELHQDQRTIKHLVLDRERLQGKKMVRVSESELPLIVVRLDVAESLLRREPVGIRLERVELA
ncbi:hypothetical protein SAMN04487969_12483 [Paenibacillus algorifonticola]|uniref:Uncharacterized protein n=1 Tax=Paenibacillus algorifonticola TaxID=684063 RepID=A0A1I2HL26_9BACL|nr:hypothetical protein [Paenibacillus algorifonticola]SFF30844.1 hypothetical protein SAMN04487969_12483 [Paenibacillus algorifonticola]